MSSREPADSPRRFLRELGILLLIVVVGFFAWANAPHSADPEPLEAVVADPQVDVTFGPVVEVRPTGSDPVRAVVFYPGVRISREGYIATWAPIVAETDTLVLIPRMPLNVPLLNRSRAADIIDAHPQIDEWWVGGHGQGGSMAASWLGDQPAGTVRGLILWASHSAYGADLHERGDIRVLSVSGSQDALTPPVNIEERQVLLPEESVYVEIAGMNHAQFGRYGRHMRDNQPTTSDEAATAALTEAHVEFFEQGVDD